MTFNFLLFGAPGPWQIIIILLVIVLLFGGKKIPELMKGLGQGIKEFKKASKDIGGENEEEDRDDRKNDKE